MRPDDDAADGTPAPAPGDRATRSLVADRGDEGVRLDVVLTQHLASVRTATRTRVQRWIEDGHVSINDRVTRRPARPLHDGDRVVLTLPWQRRVADHQAEDLPIDVLYEDAHLLIVAKPAGMIVHPTGRHRTGTLFNALLWRAQSWPDGTRPGLVHRLDRDTSGVVLVAKRREVHARAVKILRSTRATKRYLAVVVGEPPDASTIDLPLERVSDAPPRMGVAREGGLPSTTRVEVIGRGIGRGAGLALVACTLLTGRLHQIRVHLQASGWPIVGDPTYGPPSLPDELSNDVRGAIAALRGQALHAWHLTLPHPVSGEEVAVTAPLPPALQRLHDLITG